MEKKKKVRMIFAPGSQKALLRLSALCCSCGEMDPLSLCGLEMTGGLAWLAYRCQSLQVTGSRLVCVEEDSLTPPSSPNKNSMQQLFSMSFHALPTDTRKRRYDTLASSSSAFHFLFPILTSSLCRTISLLSAHTFLL